MIERRITVINKLGLHARASSKLAQTAGRFSSSISIGKEEANMVDAKSIMALMLIAAGIGTELILRANGDDESEAAKEIEELFADYFGEGG